MLDPQQNHGIGGGGDPWNFPLMVPFSLPCGKTNWENGIVDPPPAFGSGVPLATGETVWLPTPAHCWQPSISRLAMLIGNSAATSPHP